MRDDIHQLIDNPSFKHITEPVALYFSYVDTDRYDYYMKNRYALANLHSHCKNELVNYLKNKKFLAVSDESTLSVHSGTIVVSDSGIQTPFIKPYIVKDFTIELLDIINHSQFATPLSQVLAVRISQLPSPSISEQADTALFTCLHHPDAQMRDYIHFRYGKNFINDMYRYAWDNGEDAEPRKRRDYTPENLDEELYSGRKLAIEPFYCYARNDLESRYLIYGTPDYKHAVKFSGQDASFGLIHHYGKMTDQQYYESFDIESGGKPQKEKDKQVETIVIPEENAYRGLEMYMQTRCYDIPEDDEKWTAFKEYCRAAYMPNNANMIQRRKNILKEAKENGGKAVTYMPIGISESELLERQINTQEICLEDVIISKQTEIRKEYHNWQLSNSIAKMTDSVKNMKNGMSKEPAENKDVSHNLKKIYKERN